MNLEETIRRILKEEIEKYIDEEDELEEYARTLKNARRQGIGIVF